MEEWKECKLGDVCDFQEGYVNPSQGNPEYFDGDIKWLRATDLNDRYVYSTSRTLTQLGFKSAKKSAILFKPGTIAISKSGTIGRLGILQDYMCGNRAVINIIPHHTVNTFFIFYVLRNYQKYFPSMAVGSVQKNLYISILEDLKINIPDLNTQERIVTILKSLDDKIEINRRINENLEQQAQALFKSWLSNCHEEVTIGQLSQNITDYTRCNHPKVVLINSSDVTEGRFEHHNYSENKNLKGHFKKRFQKGDILYSQVRPRNRHWGYCSFNADDYLASTQLMVIRNRNGVITSHLLYQYLIDDSVWMDFTNKTETRSGTFPQGNFEELSSIKVPFGANTKKISAQLDCIYAKVYNNEEQINVLASLRDTLLPRLMSGELKVNEIEQ